MPAHRPTKTRLTTWKEVAAFFGKGERTVMRWEAERGLPVHRLPGEARSGIYADVAELEAWLRGDGAALTAAPRREPDDMPAMPPRSVVAHAPGPQGLPALLRRVAPWAALPLLLVLVAFALDRPRADAPPAAAHALYLRGLQDWAQRTPASLNAAVNEFTAAIRIDATYAEAYVGLSNSYNLPREFAAMPASEAYPLAREAAARAIALRPGLASAHAAYAFALFNGDWDFQHGRLEFERALRLEPNNAVIHHWYATALIELGEQQAALAQIDLAAELEPDSLSIQADRAFILYLSGRVAEARSTLAALADSHQDFLSPHTYLGIIALDAGDDDLFLRESLLRARLKQDVHGEEIARAAQAALASGGHVGMLHAMLQARLAALAGGGGSAVDVAHLYAMLGDGPHALAYVNLAIDRHDEDSFELVRDRRISALLGDAALNPLRARLSL